MLLDALTKNFLIQVIKRAWSPALLTAQFSHIVDLVHFASYSRTWNVIFNNYIGKQVLNWLTNILRTQKFWIGSTIQLHLLLLNIYRTSLFSNCIASNTICLIMLNNELFLTLIFSHLLALGWKINLMILEKFLLPFLRIYEDDHIISFF